MSVLVGSELGLSDKSLRERQIGFWLRSHHYQPSRIESPDVKMLLIDNAITTDLDICAVVLTIMAWVFVHVNFMAYKSPSYITMTASASQSPGMRMLGPGAI
jgi:hypothetical protein